MKRQWGAEPLCERTLQRRRKKQDAAHAQCGDHGSVAYSKPPDPLILEASDSDGDFDEEEQDVRTPTPPLITPDELHEQLSFSDSGSQQAANQSSDDESSIGETNVHVSPCVQASDDETTLDEMDVNDNFASELSTGSPETNDFNDDIDEHVFDPAIGILDTNNENNRPQEIIAEQDEPVCDCSTTTQGEALLMVLALGYRHSMSYAAMVDTLGLLNNVLQREVIRANIYQLLKHVEPEKTDDLYHIVCPECGIYLEAVSKDNLNSEVYCDDCERIVIEKAINASNYFMTLGMKKQLQNLLEKDGIADALQYRFNRQKLNEEASEDVYDGDLYKKLSSPGQPLSFEHNISYSFNSDGVPFGKSSHQQIWPIYLMVNELPPKLRVKNMLLVGIWVGTSEPDMNVFMQPFVDEANELSENGFVWKHPVEGETHSVAIPMCCVVDSQARWRLLNHKSPAGFYGCTFCEIKGEHIQGFGVRFGMREEVPETRTNQGMKDLMQEVHNRSILLGKETILKGCKGACPMMNLKHFDLALGFVPDCMHLIKGVVEQHVDCILSKLTDEEILTISERMKKIVTPSAVTRTPRALKDRAKFKASEWRNFLVLYGLIVMKDVVPRKYLVHFALLSCAMHILLQKSVTEEQIDYCRELLIIYCAQYEQYFGLVKMTHNIHLLLHVADAVKNHGPIWTHTCYPYEGKNRYLLQLAKSPLKVAKVVARKYHIFNNMQDLCKRFNASDDVVKYCQSIFSQPLWLVARPEALILLGRGKQYEFSVDEKIALQNVNIQEVSGERFEHLRISGVTFTTSSYGWSLKKSNSGAYLKNGTKCKIQSVLLLCQRRVILIVQKYTETNETLWSSHDKALRHIRRVIPSELIAINPSDVLGQYLFMDVANCNYGTCLPYGCVGD